MSLMKDAYFRGALAFDGMNGWSSVRLPDETTTVVGESREGPCTITCQLTGEMPKVRFGKKCVRSALI